MTTTTELSKPLLRALNTIAHARALQYEVTQRYLVRKEIDELLARGMSPAEALEHLRSNPPVLDPGY
ncbi:hypothetical protein D3C78_892320 [compost metagenome]